MLVATVRALKYNGGVPKTELNTPNMSALERGICNLDAHLDNMKKFGVPVVVAINAFPTDTAEEMEFIRKHCAERGVRVALSEVFAKGGEGGEELAREVLTVLDEGKANFHMLYEDELPLEEKIRRIAKEIYGADGVTFAPAAHKELANITDMGYGSLPVCIAKTQYSLSDDASLLGRPSRVRCKCPLGAAGRRRRLCCRGDRRSHDHAGSAKGSGGRKDRRGQCRCHHRAVLKGGGRCPP